jgi:hypothetical protein
MALRMVLIWPLRTSGAAIARMADGPDLWSRVAGP